MATNASTTTSVVASSTPCPNTLSPTDTEALVSVGAGTFVGVTGKVQASHNGTDYFDWPFYDVNGSLQSPGTTITLTDSTAAFLARVAGLQGMAKVRFLATGWTSGAAPVTVSTGQFGPVATPSVQAAGTGSVSSLTSSGLIKSTSPTAGIGYATGAGGTVAQATDRTTGVTINKVSGQITTQATSLAAAALVSFTVTNSTVAIGDTVVLSIQSGPSTVGTIAYVTTVAAGSFQITLKNLHASTADTGAAIINFAVIKAVAA